MLVHLRNHVFAIAMKIFEKTVINKKLCSPLNLNSWVKQNSMDVKWLSCHTWHILCNVTEKQHSNTSDKTKVTYSAALIK